MGKIRFLVSEGRECKAQRTGGRRKGIKCHNVDWGKRGCLPSREGTCKLAERERGVPASETLEGKPTFHTAYGGGTESKAGRKEERLPAAKREGGKREDCNQQGGRSQPGHSMIPKRG